MAGFLKGIPKSNRITKKSKSILIPNPPPTAKSFKKSLEYTKQFDIKNNVHFKELTVNINVNTELIDPNVIDNIQTNEENKVKEHIEKIRKTNKNNIQQSSARTGNFKGACWVKDKNMWKSQIQNNQKNFHLG